MRSASSFRLHKMLWLAQVLLAVVFGAAGAAKAGLDSTALFAKLPDLQALPLPIIRFIGIAELMAAVGLILPSLTRIVPRLTPIAANGLVIVMAFAAAFNGQRGHLDKVLLVSFLGALAAFVAWGRFSRASIPARDLNISSSPTSGSGGKS